MYPLCGCSYLVDNWGVPTLEFLPQVDLTAHATILSSTSRTTLTQTFINPSKLQSIKEASYTFPLYDGVSLVAFTCHIGERVLRGLVKERGQANADYQEAVNLGQVAGLLEQSSDASDVFKTKLGNIPADGKVVVEMTYVGELKQDAQSNGVRFTIPNIVAPRYGNVRDNKGSPSDTWTSLIQRGGLTITLDVAVEKGSVIRSLQSPSHPLSIALGRTSTKPESTFEPHQASATLSLRKGQALLDQDFVMIVNAEGQDMPVALLETHPTIPKQRALMTSLVPKFGLPNIAPEIVFIIDRSGSMGDKISTLQSALRVFLKSLPVGVMFNICSFGSVHSFMWPYSRGYDAASLNEALRYVDGIGADMGGTNMYEPVEATVKNRFKDLELEVLLLTDGEIWDQQHLFSLVNKAASENPIRFFTLGIGNAASHSLIEGIARAGDGFSQSVLENEDLDKKVVRMLKGALTPHIQDYSLEVEYAPEEEEEDFEMIDESNSISTIQSPARSDGQSEITQVKDKPAEPISLFDSTYKEPDFKTDGPAPSPADRFKDLPAISAPKLLQAPTKIPSLYPFIRSNVYIIFSPETSGKTIRTLIFRATSKHGPLELKIPVQDAGIGETIHQLAAKRAVLELEEGRGWLLNAKTDKGASVKDTYESKWENIIVRECVRLGTKFQIAGPFCSFVAVEKDNAKNGPEVQSSATESSHLEQNKSAPMGGRGGSYGVPNLPRAAGQSHVPMAQQMMQHTFVPTGPYTPPHLRGVRQCDIGETRNGIPSTFFGSVSNSRPPLFGSIPSPQPSAFGSVSTSSPRHGTSLFGSASSSATALFGCASTTSANHGVSLFSPVPPSTSSLFGSVPKSSSSYRNATDVDLFDDAGGLASLPKQKRARKALASKAARKVPPQGMSGDVRQSFVSVQPPVSVQAPQAQAQDPDKVHQIIALQTFEGFWGWTTEVLQTLELNREDVEKKLKGEFSAAVKRHGIGNADAPFSKSDTAAILATMLVTIFLEKKASDRREAWELVDEKAKNWIQQTLGTMGAEGKVFQDLRGVMAGLF